jgi:amino acid adenylation domain-containing protein
MAPSGIYPKEKGKNLFGNGVKTLNMKTKIEVINMNDKVLQKTLYESLSQFKDNIAIEYGNQVMTYEEVDRRSDYIANWILHKGIPRETFIGVLVDDRRDFILVMLGIIKAGCVFLPLDPVNPPGRLEEMIKSTRTQWIIIDNENMKRLPGIDNQGKQAPGLINVDELLPQQPSSWLTHLPGIQYSPGDKIYIYFTSGSTGTPKAIVGKNKSLRHFINWEIKTFGINGEFRFSQLTTPGFDAFLRDVLTPLCSGGRMCIPKDKDKLMDAQELVNWLDSSDIHLIHCVPSVFRLFNSTNLTPAYFKNLKFILLSGEPIYPSDLIRWYEIFGERIRLVNLWGTTETTLAKTCYFIQKSDVKRERIPVGKPIKGAMVIVLDKNMNICDEQVVGDLYIRTPFRTHGYLNDSSWNSKHFIPNPFNDDPNDLLHITGDLGLILADGNIDVLGRRDRQIKIRGIRIEPEEIETRLQQYPLIREAVVTKISVTPNNEFLCAYVTERKDKQKETDKLSITAVKDYLAQKLPTYMIPTSIIEMQEIPRKPNGKIDFHRLPQPLEGKKNIYIPPRNDLEKKLSKLWSQILGMEKVGVTDHFFDLGGNSLNIMTLINKIHKEFDVRLTLAEIFNNATIETQARIIREAREDKYTPIEPVEKKEYYRVSAAQKRMYVLHQFEAGKISYNLPMFLVLDINFSKERLETVFKKMIQRHESLRTSFELIEKEPVQRISHEVEFEIEFYTSKEPDVEHIVKNFVKPFDLSRAPLLRVGLVKREDGTGIFMFDMHHIIIDGTSYEIFLREFMAIYEGRKLSPVKLQYKDFSQWQNRRLDASQMKQQEEWWVKQVEGEIPVIDLPTDFPRPSLQSFEGGRVPFRLSPGETGQLKTLAKQEDVTLYMISLAIFNVLLARLCGQDTIIVGTDIAGRGHTDLQYIIGMFVNTLVLENYPAGEKTFREFLAQLKERTVAAFENQDYQFESLVEKLAINRDISRNPLFDVMFAFQDFETPSDDMPDISMSDLTKNRFEYEDNTAKFDLTLSGGQFADSLFFSFEYCTNLFKKETIERFIAYYKTIVSSVIETPGKRLGQVEIISREEKRQILNDFNNTAAESPQDKIVHRLFQEQVERTPDNIAVIEPQQEEYRTYRTDMTYISYRELNEKTNRLARRLRSNGIRQDQLVGVLLNRSLALVESILATWKAGGAYIPIDPQYPQQRINSILNDSNAKVILTQSAYPAPQPALNHRHKIIDLSTPWDSLPGDTAGGEENIETDDLAYVIYTSGSTGKPKGVTVEHMGMTNHIQAKIHDLQLTGKSIVAQNASQTFDISVWQMFAALCTGGKTVIYPDQLVLEPTEFLSRVIKDEITILEVVPSYLSMMMDTLDMQDRNFRALDYLLVTGEELKPHLVKRWFRDYPQIKMINAYGPTEASDDITHHLMEQAPEVDRVPIGKPLRNLHIYIVDEYMKLCPPGVKGEILVSGIGVGRGYLQDVQKTAQAFIEDPFNEKKGIRLYKTGDLGSWLPDGSIAFFGREDHQVKIRGFRIELGEIESQLLTLAPIKDVAVLAIDEANPGNNRGNKSLCAYFVADKPLDSREIKIHLSEHLPDYMVPSYMVQMEKIPLTPNGKVDRKAFPLPGATVKEKFMAPGNEVEEKLVEIWSEVLGIEKDSIPIDANFFNLGGHSLKAIAMVSMIHKKLNVKIPLAEVFRTPAIKELGEYIMSADREKFISIEPVSRKEYYPLSSGQNRLYILQKIDPGSVAYNMPGTFVFDGEINRTWLKNIVKKVIRRHDSLRTSIILVGNQPFQKIHHDIPFDIEFFDLTGMEETETQRKARVQKIIDNFVKPFDLSQPPLLRVGVIDISETKHVIMADMHHIISDGVSHEILGRDITNFYRGILLPPLRLQYKDYSAWETSAKGSAAIKQQEAYWLKEFAGEIPILDLPVDHPRPPVRRFGGQTLFFEIGKEETRGLKELAQENETTLFMVLLAVYNVFLAKICAQDDIVVGTGVAGRRHADLELIIGFFVNILALRNYPRGDITFAAFLKEVKERSLQAFENQDYKFEDLVDRLAPQRDTSRNPIFDTAFGLDINETPQGVDDTQSEKERQKQMEFQYEYKMARYDLILRGEAACGKLFMIFEYSTALFENKTIESFVLYLRKVISAVLENQDIKLNRIQITHDFYHRDIDIPRIDFGF